MYQIANPHRYSIWDFQDKRYISYFDSIDELISFIADGYWELSEIADWNTFEHITIIKNSFIEKCACSENENNFRRYFIFDGYTRIINIHSLEEQALALYQKRKSEGKINWYSHHIFYMKLNSKNIPPRCSYLINAPNFREGPVPYTGKKWRGGPWQKGPHTFHIKKMYANPEFQFFNRGSVKDVPSWWDDKWRHNQRSWKTQSKKRHQWE